MALISCLSVNGSPGVTTTVLGMAFAWPKPVIVVDADPTGAMSIPAGFLRGERPAVTLTDLAAAQRVGQLAEQLPRALLKLSDADGSPLLLPGVTCPDQASTADSLWAPLVGALRQFDAAGHDVLVDAGRVGLQHHPEPLVAASDMTVLMLRSTLPSLVAAKGWIERLRTLTGDAITTVIHAAAYPAADVRKLLGVPVLAEIPHDPAGAAVLSNGATPPRRHSKSPLVKTFATTAPMLSRQAADRQAGAPAEHHLDATP